MTIPVPIRSYSFAEGCSYFGLGCTQLTCIIFNKTNEVLQSSKQKSNLPLWFVDKFVDGIKLIDEIHSIQAQSMQQNDIRKTQNEIKELVRKIRSGLGDKTKNATIHIVFNQLVLAVNQMNFELLKVAISLLRNKRLLSDKEFIKLRSSLYLFNYSFILVIK